MDQIFGGCYLDTSCNLVSFANSPYDAFCSNVMSHPADALLHYEDALTILCESPTLRCEPEALLEAAESLQRSPCLVSFV